MLEERELLRSSFFRLRHDLGSELGVRAEDSVVADHVKPGRRDERSDPGTEVGRLEHERDCAVAPGLFQSVAKLAVARLDQALLRDGRGRGR
jgi:hypothetical protein